ncbi:MAG: glycosyltransferase family 1 protein [Myxococcales bacterium]
MTRVALSLAGCDFGRSGVSVVAQQLLPRLGVALESRGASVFAIGTRREQESIDWQGQMIAVPSAMDAAAASAVFALAGLSLLARSFGADALYLPAANRRIVGWPRIATVGTVHDLAQFHVANKYGRLRQLYVEHLLTPTLRRLTRITTVSQATADDVVRFAGVSPDRIVVVPNGVTLEGTPPAVSPHDRPYFLYPARLEHPGKNHIRLIQAFAQSGLAKTHDLVLCGADWGALAQIQDTAHRMGVEKQVVYAGFVSRETLTGFLAHADAVVVAGLFEGFGLQAVEALALGRPVVASNTGALPEVIGELGVLFNPTNVQEIGKALGRSVNDEILRARCRRDGPKRASKFSWDHAAETIADLLIEVSNATP